MRDDIRDKARSRAETARAIEKVVAAEKAGGVTLADARRDAALRIEQAQNDMRALIDRTHGRIERLQASRRARVDTEIAAMQDEAKKQAEAHAPPDEEALKAAAARLAARLTGGGG
ncbi:MAG: hypothetical protein C0606_16245 [Hyphomicrobiales bacterium]|nr:MAG: hypothetical protein C0606_16245 [Hyphomicrobiales bacterium]